MSFLNIHKLLTTQGVTTTIVSISLNDEYLQALDEIQESYDLIGRSEAVRMAITTALDEMHDMVTVEGPVEGVLIVVRNNHSDPWMFQIQDKYQDAIKTHLHSHLKDHSCLEVMVISADSTYVAEMISMIKAQGKTQYVKFVRR